MSKSRVEGTNFYSKDLLNIRENLFDLSKPAVMGIINTTPDSFYKYSRKTELNTVLQEVEKQLSEGASFIDIGGYSSRPGAENISEEEELKRILPYLKEIVRVFPSAIVSIDTFRAKVAAEAIENGASIINDISGFSIDEDMLKVLQNYPVPYVLTHLKGTPQNMAEQSSYTNLFQEMYAYFSEKIKLLKEIGLTDMIIDPGFGFAKNREQNYEILQHLEDFRFLNHPLLVGISRKSMIYQKLGVSPEEALNGTTVLNTLAIQKGAKILRAHDVKAAREVIQLLC